MRMPKDSVTTVLCVVFVVLLLGAVGPRGRESARQVMCAANLNRLTLAWLQYAHDNSRNIINGMAGMHRAKNGGTRTNGDDPDVTERAWVGADWGEYKTCCIPAPPERQLAALTNGALWPYTQETSLYHCPSHLPGHLRSYEIVDAMNGMTQSGTDYYRRIGRTKMWINHLEEIDLPGPDKRMVFIDIGRATPHSYAVNYNIEAWWEPPPLGHDHGTNVSFADGHTDLWHWQDPRTIEAAQLQLEGRYWSDAVQVQPHNQDLRRLQMAVWGRLGYAE